MISYAVNVVWIVAFFLSIFVELYYYIIRIMYMYVGIPNNIEKNIYNAWAIDAKP